MGSLTLEGNHRRKRVRRYRRENLFSAAKYRIAPTSARPNSRLEQVQEMNREQTRKCGVGSKASQSHAITHSNLSQLPHPPI